MQYFDTIPVAVSLNILKSGYLFAPSEKGNHCMYKFLGIGNDEKNPVITDNTMGADDYEIFLPRAMKNLLLVDELDNLACISDLKV